MYYVQVTSLWLLKKTHSVFLPSRDVSPVCLQGPKSLVAALVG